MFVSRWMTPKVITIDKNESLGTALRLMRENRIRRLPVVSKGKLVGIVSDRDLKGALPSQATSLDVWELHGLLDRLHIADIMTKNVVTTTPGATIERVAMIMMEKRIEGLPVLDPKGNLVGIVTEGDVFRALTEVTGVGRKTTRISLVIPDRPGSIMEVADVVRAKGGKIYSILSTHAKVPNGNRELVMRVEISDGKAAEVRKELSMKYGEVSVLSDAESA
ncbi:MAG TPA: CBS and ACT domain-containing protein [Thermoanaerobaculia bacterium]|nr:CBS and ACT domain-containing protein [Thermoanaerobaculia bacterium]